VATGPALEHPRGSRPVLILAAAVAALTVIAAVLALGGPWLSGLQIERAAKNWTHSPGTAYSQLEDAAGLNPLSAQPYLVAGSIALRRGKSPAGTGNSRVRWNARPTMPTRRWSAGRSPRPAENALARSRCWRARPL
jgi:hypothetical protein